MKFCVIGPTYPFRGGIAHYTTLLVKHLRGAGHAVQFYSYRRQYPRWLFPGNTKPDPSADILHVECEYLLDSLNPFTWWQTYQRIQKEAPDVLILQWWTPFWTPMLVAMTHWIKHNRQRRIRMLFICHHITPPEGGPLDLNLARFALNRGDFFLAHNEADYLRLRESFRDKVVRMVALPTFDMFNLEPLDVHQARAQLGLDPDTPVVLFFGFVRRYKGVSYLIEALPHVLPRQKIKLLIVGEFWEDLQVYTDLVARLGLQAQVQIVPRYVPNEEVAVYFSAADLVAVPYVETATSAVVHLAFGFNKPVVGTTVSGLAEVVVEGETGYLVPPADARALADAIVRFFQGDAALRFARTIELEKEERSWPQLVRVIETMLREK